MRRRGVVAIAAGLLLCLPTAALAQEAEADTSVGEAAVGIGVAESIERAPSQDTDQTLPDETGIGEPDAVECRGAVAARVVDLDGAPVDGAVLSVAGEQVAGSGSVESLCGEVAATLLSAPEGYAPAGPTTMNVQVRNAATTAVTFTVDPVEVLGTQFERPSTPTPVPDSTDQMAAPEVEADPELAATGPEDAPTLLLFALLSLLAGTLLVAAAPAAARARA